MIIDDHFPHRLEQVRIRKNLSQQGLADASGVAAAQVSRYETGRTKPRGEIVARLAEALNVSVNWLANGGSVVEAVEVDPITVLLPHALKERLEVAASTEMRQIGAEIVARLEQSFDGPVKQSEVEELLQKLNERDDTAQQIAARDHLLSITGVYLRLVVDRVKKDDDALSNHLMDLTGRYADCIVHADFGAAFQVAMELVRVGSQVGILDEQGQVKPEFEHLKPELPARPKRIVRSKKPDDSNT